MLEALPLMVVKLRRRRILPLNKLKRATNLKSHLHQ
jgi:hypothetical protein